MEQLSNSTIEQFSEMLAAKTSTPGGGGAAAVCGGLAASLAAMALNFTIGKKKFLPYDELLKEVIECCETERKQLITLIDEDSKGFEPLSKAYSLPKDAPNRADIMEEATLLALRAPLEMVRHCEKVIDLLIKIEGKCSKLLLSDVICSYHLALAGLKSASVNVYVNTKFLTNRDLAVQIEKEVDEAISKYEPLVAEMTEKLTAELRG